MKRKVKFCLLLIFTHLIAFPQNIFPVEGNVGIGTNSPSDLLHIYNSEVVVSDDKCINGTAFSHSVHSAGWAQGNAFDNIFEFEDSNVWSTSALSSPFQGWIAYKFNTNEKINILRLYPRLDHAPLNFKNFSILGSNNSTNGIDGDWTTLSSGLSTNNSIEWQEFYFDNNQTYLWYKIQGPAQIWASNLYYVQVAEIEMKEYLSNPEQTVLIAKRDGKVGIGSTHVPDGYKFSVNGKAIMESVKVQLSSKWPDYVFNENYSLRNLSDLEKYIRTNNHLPDIPSAEVMQKEGLDVGEMNIRLLQKIEELTLYVIEQNKKIELLIKYIESKEKENTMSDH